MPAVLKTSRAVLRAAWLKLLGITLLYACVSVANFWFGVSFFFALFFGFFFARIIVRAIDHADFPKTAPFLATALLLLLPSLYCYWAFYTSFYLSVISLLPWDILSSMHAIAEQGSIVSGYVVAGEVEYKGTAYYWQWLIETGAAVAGTWAGVAIFK